MQETTAEGNRGQVGEERCFRDYGVGSSVVSPVRYTLRPLYRRYSRIQKLQPVITFCGDYWEIRINEDPRDRAHMPDEVWLEADYFEKHTVGDLDFILRFKEYESDFDTLLQEIPILKPGDMTEPEDELLKRENWKKFGTD